MYLLFFLLSLCTVAAKSVFAETAMQDQRNRISVTVNNLSTSVDCAEDDNVYLPFLSPRLSSFRIEVKHPSYIAAATEDRSAPDWAGCDMSDDPVFDQEPRQVTFYQTPKLWLVGYTHPTTWQANPVPFRVGRPRRAWPRSGTALDRGRRMARRRCSSSTRRTDTGGCGRCRPSTWARMPTAARFSSARSRSAPAPSSR